MLLYQTTHSLPASSRIHRRLNTWHPLKVVSDASCVLLLILRDWLLSSVHMVGRDVASILLLEVDGQVLAWVSLVAMPRSAAL